MSQNLGSLPPILTQCHTSSTPSSPLNMRRNLWMDPSYNSGPNRALTHCWPNVNLSSKRSERSSSQFCAKSLQQVFSQPMLVFRPDLPLQISNHTISSQITYTGRNEDRTSAASRSMSSRGNILASSFRGSNLAEANKVRSTSPSRRT